MSDSVPFIDYYNILGVHPNCSSRSLETAYHFLAKKYHPDHTDKPDIDKFTDIIEAFRAINNPDKRAAYNTIYSRETGYVFSSVEYENGDDDPDEHSALSDANAHRNILLFLYKRRREQARDAGVGRYYVQEMLKCSDELFEFHIWYLREKGFIATTEQGTLAITIEGVDHVISMSRNSLKERLLLAQSSEEQGQQGF